MFKGFKDFAMRGSMIDMAIGIIVGIAIGTVIKSLVTDIIMPPVGLALGGIDFSNMFVVLKEGAAAGPYATLADAQRLGATTVNYGVFVNTLITFLIVMFAVYAIVQVVKRYRGAEAETKVCSFCSTSIPKSAVRCPNCTSEIQKEYTKAA
jgi:large conductance mechanosensitive channel